MHRVVVSSLVFGAVVWVSVPASASPAKLPRDAQSLDRRLGDLSLARGTRSDVVQLADHCYRPHRHYYRPHYGGGYGRAISPYRSGYYPAPWPPYGFQGGYSGYGAYGGYGRAVGYGRGGVGVFIGF